MGQINHGLYSIHQLKAFHILTNQKRCNGYWSEYVKAKIAYKLKSAEIHWVYLIGMWDMGLTQSIFQKSPSFPQIGFNWQIKKNLNFLFS